MINSNINLNDLDTIQHLNNLGVDIFDEQRNYWLIRTKGGDYFEDFYFSGSDNVGYVGIEWNEILKVSKNETKEELAKQIHIAYPDEKQQQCTYISGIILKFVNEIKKGDIVLIPSANSKTIAFGEVLEDDIYLADDDESDQNFLDLLDDLEDELIGNKKEITPMKKRRRVKWFKHINREKLDPDLRPIVYAHQTIVDLKPYAPFVDRTLSDFYIKGTECFFTYKVNRSQNIPYMQMNKFLNINTKIIDFINESDLDFTFDDDLVLKINVQSKGPVQFKGPMKKILIFGFSVMFFFGGKISLSLDGFSVECGGIPALLDSANKIYTNYTHSQEYESLEADIKESKTELELQIPETIDTN